MRSFELLVEIQHLQGILLESRLDYLKAKYVIPLTGYIENGMWQPYHRAHTWVADNPNDPEPEPHPHYDELFDVLRRREREADPHGHNIGKPSQTSIGEDAFNWLVSLDPDRSKKHTQWLITTFLKGAWRPEDGYKATQYLAMYDHIKPRLPVAQRDLNHITNLNDLYYIIAPFEEIKSQKQTDRDYEAEMAKQSQIVLNTARYKIVIPLTREASCHYGVNTQWCTAAKEDNYFDDYYRDGDLFIILDKKTNRRWQFHFEENQFMDERDREINISDFISDHPEVAEFFRKYDEDHVIMRTGRRNRATDPKPHYIIRRNRGIIIKEKPGLVGTNIAYFIADNEGKLARYRIVNYSQAIPGEIAEALNLVGIKGDQDGVNEMFYRNGKWGTIATVGTDVVQVQVNPRITATWKVVEVPQRDNFLSKAYFQLVKPNGGTLIYKATVLSGTDFFTHDEGPNFTNIYMPLIKARDDIKFWIPDYSKYTTLGPADKEWLLENKPDMCPPHAVYDKYGKSIITGSVINKWIEAARLTPTAHHTKWIGDILVIEPTQYSMDEKTPLGDVMATLGLWKEPRSENFVRRMNEAPYIYYLEDGVLHKGVAELTNDVHFVLAIPLEALIVHLSRSFGSYERYSWSKFLGVRRNQRKNSVRTTD